MKEKYISNERKIVIFFFRPITNNYFNTRARYIFNEDTLCASIKVTHDVSFLHVYLQSEKGEEKKRKKQKLVIFLFFNSFPIKFLSFFTFIYSRRTLTANC